MNENLADLFVRFVNGICGNVADCKAIVRIYINDETKFHNFPPHIKKVTHNWKDGLEFWAEVAFLGHVAHSWVYSEDQLMFDPYLDFPKIILPNKSKKEVEDIFNQLKEADDGTASSEGEN